jgi:hypothetical protein
MPEPFGGETIIPVAPIRAFLRLTGLSIHGKLRHMATGRAF